MRFGNSDQPRGPVGPRQQFRLGKRGKWIIGIIVVVAVLFQVVPRLNNAYTEWLWYRSVDASSVYVTEMLTRAGLFAIVAIAVAGSMIASAVVAYRNQPILVRGRGQETLARYQHAVESGNRWVLMSGPVLLGVVAGLFAQMQWQTVLMFFHSTPFGIRDPQFGHDISFYAFELGFWRLLLTWAMVVIVLSLLVALATHYIFGGIRFGSGDGVLSPAARIHLIIVVGIFVLAKAAGYWLDRYDLMMNENDVFTGAGYSDVNALLPAKIFLFVVSILCAIAFFTALLYKDLRIPALAMVLLVFSAGIVGSAWPMLVEQFSVNPNRAEKEAEYISRNIDATRDAYAIGDDDVTYERDWGAPSADPQEASTTSATLNNIRVLDPNVLGPTFTQQQQRKNFFGFTDQLSIDRYEVDGQLQDYIVGAREIDPRSLSENQRDWVNRRTVYTHGTGLVMAPANRVDELATDDTSERGGFPSYTNVEVVGNATATDPVPVEQSRIYFGPLIGGVRDDYSIVDATGGPREYDTDTDRYTYAGTGGVPVGGIINRLAFSLRFTERNILFSNLIGPDSRIIYDRNPIDRVKKVAPWLTPDEKTYPTIVDGRVVWIVDGYTTLDSYPYAQRVRLGLPDRDPATGIITADNQVSYARNSVKAVVDAYDGTVTLYENDPDDPVLKTWRKVFPDLVKPQDAMSEDLRNHLRYPEDLFNVQRQLIAKYHVSDPNQFFTNDAFWSIPADLSTRGATAEQAAQPLDTQDVQTGGLEATDTFTPQPPSYVIAADPQTGKPSFQLITVFRGFQREFFSAHMSASADPDNYGHITVRTQGPAADPPDGPTQALQGMQTNPTVAEDRRAWGQTARITEGNMLPLALNDGSIMYVVPVYTQRLSNQGAADNTFPRLLRVMVFYNKKVGYARSVYEALQQVSLQSSRAATGTAENSEPAPATSATSPSPGDDSAAAPSANTPAEEGDGAAEPGSAPPATGSDAQDAAIEKIDEALGKINDANASGNLGDLGTALEELQAAVDAYNAAKPN